MNGENKKYRYQEMDDAELCEELEELENQFKIFLQTCEYPKDIEVYESVYSLVDMIIRTDKRRAYYYFYHNMEINECKTAALYAYWILKLRPFVITDIRYRHKRQAVCINEAFAIYLICSALFFSKKITAQTIANTSYYEKLYYSFRFRNISIDSMVLLVESMNEETFKKNFDQIV